MNNCAQLIIDVRPRSHRYGLYLTARYRDLFSREEACSQVDLSLIQAARRFDPARGVSFFAYARVWIRRDLAKCTKRRIARRLLQSNSPLPDVGEQSPQLDERILVDQLLSRLTATERSIVEEHIIEGKSLTELAYRNNRHRAWACRLLKKALKQLRPLILPSDSFENARPVIGRFVHHAVADPKIAP